MWSELQNSYFSDPEHGKEIYLTESHLMSESIFMSQSCIGISMEQECKHLYQKVCVSADEIVTVIGFELTVIKNGKNCTANPV